MSAAAKRDTTLRQARFLVGDRSRLIDRLELMMLEMGRMASDLTAVIEREEKNTKNADPTHFAYSPLASASRQRRQNLLNSINDMSIQQSAARIQKEEAEAKIAYLEPHNQNEDDVRLVSNG